MGLTVRDTQSIVHVPRPACATTPAAPLALRRPRPVHDRAREPLPVWTLIRGMRACPASQRPPLSRSGRRRGWKFLRGRRFCRRGPPARWRLPPAGAQSVARFVPRSREWRFFSAQRPRDDGGRLPRFVLGGINGAISRFCRGRRGDALLFRDFNSRGPSSTAPVVTSPTVTRG